MAQDKKPSSAPTPSQLADLLGIGREETTDSAAESPQSDLTRLLHNPGNEAAPPDNEPPHVDGYDVHSQLGAGGMGTVWRATQLGTRRQVALKLLSMAPSAAARMRFTREVELAATLDHPNIARVYDSGLHYGNYYFAMELIDGVPLDQYVRDHSLGRADILRLLRKVCDAVQHAHERGIIHRDLKPANILVDSQGQPHVLDFGLARSNLEQHDATLTRDGAVAGTIAYMAPEQAAGEIRRIGTFSDVYSIGVMLYELLVEQPPHSRQGSAYEMLRRIAEQEVLRPRAANPRISRELEALLLKALAHEPGDRYATAGELGRDIDNYLNSEPLTARPPTTIYFLARRIRKHRWAVTAAALVALVLVGVIVSAWVRVSDERGAAQRSAIQERAARQDAQQQRDQAIAARVAAVAAETRSRSRLIHAMVNDGWQRFEREDVSTALLTHVEALRLAEEDAAGQPGSGVGLTAHRLRVPALLGELPALELLLDHGGEVRQVAIAPNGSAAITVGDKVRVWDLATGAHRCELRHDKPILCAAISPDGRMVATGGGDKCARLWDLATGRPVGDPMGHIGSVAQVVFSPDSRLLATSGSDGSARTWSALDGRPAGGSFRNPGRFGQLMFTPDSTRVVAVEPTHTIRMSDVTTGRVLWSVPIPYSQEVPDDSALMIRLIPAKRYAAVISNGTRAVVPHSQSTARVVSITPDKEFERLLRHHWGVESAAISPDGRFVVTSTSDLHVWLWDLENTKPGASVMEPLHDFAPPPGTGFSLACFSPDFRSLAVAARDRTVRLWSIPDMRPLLPPLRHTGQINSVAFSPDGSRLFVAGDDGLVRVWATRRSSRQPSLLSASGHGVVSGDGRRIAALTANNADGRYAIHDVDAGRVLAAIDHTESVEPVELAFAPDGNRVLTTLRRKPLWSQGDAATRPTWPRWDATNKHAWRLWDTTTGLARSPAVGLGNYESRNIAWSPDGSTFTIDFFDHPSVAVWNAQWQSQLAVLQPGGKKVYDVRFTPDGRWIAVVPDSPLDGVLIYDAAVVRKGSATQPVRHLSHHKCHSMMLWPGSTHLVSIGGNTWKLWDATTGELLFSHAWSEETLPGAFSADGRSLAFHRSGMVEVWDLDRRIMRFPPIIHRDNVDKVAFSRDGAILATGCVGGDVRLWDAHTGQPVSAPYPHKRGLHNIAFSNDGLLVMCGATATEHWQLVPDTRSVAALTASAEVLSAQRMDPVAGPVPLSADECRRLWKQLTQENKR